MRPCSHDDPDAVEGDCDEYGESRILMGPVTYKHFVDVLKGKKPSVTNEDLIELQRYNEEYLSQK